MPAAGQGVQPELSRPAARLRATCTARRRLPAQVSRLPRSRPGMQTPCHVLPAGLREGTCDPAERAPAEDSCVQGMRDVRVSTGDPHPPTPGGVTCAQDEGALQHVQLKGCGCVSVRPCSRPCPARPRASSSASAACWRLAIAISSNFVALGVSGSKIITEFEAMMALQQGWQAHAGWKHLQLAGNAHQPHMQAACSATWRTPHEPFRQAAVIAGPAQPEAARQLT